MILALMVCGLPAVASVEESACLPGKLERLGEYDLVADRIAVRFSKPLAAGSLAGTVAAADWADGICVAEGKKPSLEYKGPVNESATDVVQFGTPKGCSATARALLARAIVENVSSATAAGLVIERRPSGRVEVLTDELIVELAEELPEGDSIDELEGFRFSAADPFSPQRCLYFRLYDRACVKDLTSTGCRAYRSCVDCRATCRNKGRKSAQCKACAAFGCKKRCARDPQDCESCCKQAAGSCIRESCERKDLIAALEKALQAGGPEVKLVTPYLIPLTPSDEEKAFDGWLKGQKNLEDNLTGTIGVSFTGNEAAGESDFKVGADIKLDLGSYPGQLRVGAGAQVQFKDNVVTEDVTKLRVSYDYYFERWLELYGFLERFTNNFLSIEQRYESGVGVLFEWDAKAGPGSELCVDVPGPVHYHRSESGAVPREIRVTQRAQRMLEVYRQRLRREAREKGAVSDETKKEYCRYKLGIQKRHARFQGGLAISLFGDFEQPDELTITAKPLGDPPPPEQGGPEEIEVKVRPPSAHRFRVTLRPSLTYRPNNRTELFAHYYFKAALDEPQVESDLEPSGEAGRQEFLVGTKITLAADETGGQKVALSLSAEQFHDRFPPSVTAKAALGAFGVMDPTDEQLASLSFATDGVEYAVSEATALRARRTHTVYKFALSISW